jgi:type II secretory pathway pseudopilin PulG
MRCAKGLTLAELLILVVIIGILSVVVVPTFTQASPDTIYEDALRHDLIAVRNYIELYRRDHNGKYPDGSNFIAQMTMRTNRGGEVMPFNGEPQDYPCGPYLSHFPSNPFVDRSVSDRIEVGTSAPGGGNAGWHYNPQTGSFSRDDSHTNR